MDTEGHKSGFKIAVDDSLRLNSQWVIPSDKDLRQEILRDAHSIHFSVHPGGKKMYKDLKVKFWWKGMKKDISDFVLKCLACQQVKVAHKRPGGLLKSLEISKWK